MRPSRIVTDETKLMIKPGKVIPLENLVKINTKCMDLLMTRNNSFFTWFVNVC